MQAFLLTGEKNEVLEYALKMAGNFERVIEFSLKKIDDARELQKLTSLNFGSAAFIIKDIEDATTEAASAFLKNLEEPQGGIAFMLLATSSHKLLPTIVSRCQIIRVSTKPSTATPKAVSSFLNSSQTDKLTFIDGLRKKEEAVAFVKEIIIFLHDKLIKEDNNLSKTARSIAAAQKTLHALSANGNPGLQLTNFVVNSPTTPLD